MARASAIGRFTGGVDTSLSRVYQALTYRDLWLYLSAVVFILLAMWTTPFSVVLREDAYNFVIKGMEVTRGDFSLDRAQAIGWPLVLGLVFFLLDVDDIFEAMFLARWTSIACVALGIIVLGKACRQAFDEPRYHGFSVAVVLTFMLVPLTRFAARSAMTEAIFLVCVLLSTLFFLRAVTREGSSPGYVCLAAFAAACAYYVRPNGLFIFASMVVALVLIEYGDKRRLLKRLLLAAATFFLTTLPYLYARYTEFGSAFDYGPNSKYFVEHYEHVWANNIDAPSLWTYLQTHGWHDYYNRFIDGGLMQVLSFTSDNLLPGPWMILSFIGFCGIFVYRKQNAYILPLTLLISIAGMSMVFHIFGSLRHLIYFIPLLMIIAGFCFAFLSKPQIKAVNIVATILIVMGLSSTRITWLDPTFRTIPEVKDHWAVWAAGNLEGNVAIVEGGDLLEMSEHYKIKGWRIIRKYADVTPRITAIRPGIHDDLSDALEEFKKRDIRYLVTDRVHAKRRSYLKDVTDQKWRDHFRHLGYFRIGDKGAQLFDVNLYEVVYQSL